MPGLFLCLEVMMLRTTQAAAIGGLKSAKVDKGDATTRAARDIIAREMAAREAKTARLRALRLAKEAEDRISDATPILKKPSAAKTRKPRVAPQG